MYAQMRVSQDAAKAQTMCPLCGEPVSLERCKTDEDGRAIHEDCYVRKVCSKGLSGRSDSGAASTT
jgi:hypothetical protein